MRELDEVHHVMLMQAADQHYMMHFIQLQTAV